MRRFVAVLIASSAIVVSGCYHAVVDTGRAPTGAPNVTPWAHSFIYGLVPPAVTETAKKCPGGVAKVETQQTFLNGLVAAITGGIYTPMTISYTCAGGSADATGVKTLKVGAAGAQATMQEAVELSAKLGTMIQVQF